MNKTSVSFFIFCYLYFDCPKIELFKQFHHVTSVDENKFARYISFNFVKGEKKEVFSYFFILLSNTCFQYSAEI